MLSVLLNILLRKSIFFCIPLIQEAGRVCLWKLSSQFIEHIEYVPWDHILSVVKTVSECRTYLPNKNEKIKKIIGYVALYLLCVQYYSEHLMYFKSFILPVSLLPHLINEETER